MNCPSCHSENPAANAYCGSCGTVLNDAAVVVPHYGDQKRLVKREIVFVAAGIFALITAGWVAWYLLVSTRSPASVVRAFIEADRSGHYTREQDLVLNNLENRVALSLFQGLRKQSNASPFQNYRIVNTSSSDNNRTAFVQVEITVPRPQLPLLTSPSTGAPPGHNTTTMDVTFVLMREAKDWKIDAGQTLAGVVTLLTAAGVQQLHQLPSGLFPNLPNLQIPPGWPNFGRPPGTNVQPPSAAPPPSTRSSGASGPI